MYLRKLDLKNFRSCLATSVVLQEDLTVLVGENNSGKSNVIDALRLVTTPSGRRSRYFEIEDLTRGSSDSEIRLVARYGNLTGAQQGIFSASLDTKMKESVLGTEVDLESGKGGRLPRPSPIAGPANGPDAEPSLRERIRHVYLAPLRDAKRELDSPEGGRLLSILQLLLSKDEQDSLLEDTNEKLKSLESDSRITGPVSKLSGHVENLTRPVRAHEVSAKFSELRLRQLVRNIRLKMAESGLDVCDLADSGLGYANLLFISSVLLELQSAADAELTLFLVEEPESHLHPQLQTVLLEYLREQANESLKPDDDCCAGRIQVICSTHSPHLASSVPIEKIVVLRSSRMNTTKAIAVSDLDLTKSERGKISRYLDATKANLFFASTVVLVEGMAEVLLMPSLARRRLTEKGRKSRLASGLTVIGIGCVDFEPYVKLLLSQSPQGDRILERLIIITDSDPDPEDDWKPVTRKANLESLAEELTCESSLHVLVSDLTLEADMMAHSTNRAVLRTAYLEQHPLSSEKWKAFEEADTPERELYVALRSETKLIQKGEFAQTLCRLLDSGESFAIPNYLEEALDLALPDL